MRGNAIHILTKIWEIRLIFRESLLLLIEVNQRMVGGQGVVKAPLSGEIWNNPSSLCLFLGLEMVQE